MSIFSQEKELEKVIREGVRLQKELKFRNETIKKQNQQIIEQQKEILKFLDQKIEKLHKSLGTNN